MEEYILVVDHLIERQKLLTDILKQLRRNEMLPSVKVCENPEAAIRFSSVHPCPIVFTEVELPGMSGFSMIRRIRESNSRTNFILLADRQEYIVQALTLKLRLSGSILGTPDPEAVAEQLNNLWYPLQS